MGQRFLQRGRKTGVEDGLAICGFGGSRETGDVTADPPTISPEITKSLYNELRALAWNQLRSERRGHSLQPTDLVNEACLRILGSGVVVISRAHLRALAATQMRRILVDHERRRRKRIDGRLIRTSLPEIPGRASEWALDILKLDDALTRLASLSERQAYVLELRYFGGLTVGEVAEVVGISERSVKKDTAIAFAWLKRELSS